MSRVNPPLMFAPHLANDVFKQQNQAPAMDFQDIVRQVAEADNQQQQDQIMQQAFHQLLFGASQANGALGDGIMPQNQVSVNNGYNDLYDPVLFGMQTQMPRQLTGVEDFKAIVNQYNPQLYQYQEGLREQLEQLAPYAKSILQEQYSLYDPQTGQGFESNLLHVMNQRARENDVYAFK